MIVANLVVSWEPYRDRVSNTLYGIILLITKTVKNHCRKHVLNVVSHFECLESVECWCSHLGKCCQVDRSVKDCICNNCLLMSDNTTLYKNYNVVEH